MTQCAVWFMRYGSADYELCDDETEAASYAYHLAESGDGALLGVQFADGRTIAADHWEAPGRYAEEVKRAEAQRPTPPPPAMRKVRDPFSKQLTEVLARDPSWLGEQLGS